MVYTNSVPQANQQISATQGPILANFAFLQQGIGIEHNFVPSSNGSTMYHLQASMPNRTGGAPVALPAGTNGMYYVLGGIAYFYDGTLSYPLNPFCLRAAVNFDGSTSSPTPIGMRSSYNVSSVTYGGHQLGDYVINFTNNMPSVNYTVVITGGRTSSDKEIFGCIRGSTASYGTGGSPIQLNKVEVEFFTAGGSASNAFIANVMVFGG